MHYIEYCKQLFHRYMQIPDFAGMTGFGAFCPFSDSLLDRESSFSRCLCLQLAAPRFYCPRSRAGTRICRAGSPPAILFVTTGPAFVITGPSFVIPGLTGNPALAVAFACSLQLPAFTALDPARERASVGRDHLPPSLMTDPRLVAPAQAGAQRLCF